MKRGKIIALAFVAYLVGCPVQCSEKLRLKSPVKLLIQHSDF